MENEKRLIDAIAYRKVLREEMDYLLELAKTKGYHTLKERMGLEVAIADLGDMPTVGAVEVVHGRWIEVRGRYTCSVCKGKALLHFGAIGACLSNYCPNCGAKMDGDGNANRID